MDADDELTQSLTGSAPLPSPQTSGSAQPQEDELVKALATPAAAPALQSQAQEPDYASMPWLGSNGVLDRARQNTGSSALGVARGLGNAVADGAMNVAHGDLPGKSFMEGLDAYGAYGAHRLGQMISPEATDWVEKNVTGYKVPGDEEWAQKTAPVRGVVQDYANRYGSVAGFKKALATDPVPIGLDALTVMQPALKYGFGAGAADAGAAARTAAPLTEAELGEHLRDAAAASKAAVDAAYAHAASVPGDFSPAAVDTIWNRAANALVRDRSFPDPDVFKNSPDLANARGALDTLRTHLTTLSDRPFDMSTLEAIRRDLRSFAEGGSSGHHIGNLINGFDEGVKQAAGAPGLFSGDGAQAAGSIEAARRAYVDHLNNFGANAPQHVKNAVRTFSDADSLHVPDDALAHRAGTQLSQGLLNGANGPLVQQHLDRLGLTPQVNSYLRGKLLSGTPNDVTRNMARPMASQVFTPEEMDRVRQLNEADQGSRIGRLTGHVVKLGARAGALAAGVHEGSLAGMLMMPAVEQGLEHVAGRYFAPPTSSLAERLAMPPATPLQDALTGAAKSLPRTGAIDNGILNVEGRPDRAAGGKVGHQHLVDRLLRGVEKAKKAEQARTSAILKQPDETVAKALRVAQAAI